jgi:4-hydroxybenzoate polyprenyltransferase/phosphoserine phosphatase
MAIATKQIPLDARGKPALPLYVDLDGALIASNTLLESLLRLLRQAPWLLFALPVWLARGRAHFKHRIAERVGIDAALLPYRESVLSFVRQARKNGRPVILATAADRRIARAVADHLQLFDQVLASDGWNNLKSERKLDAIRRSGASGGFDYLGDSRADLPIWRAANAALVVNPSRRLVRSIEREGHVERRFDDERGHRVLELIGAMRVYQWTKNTLLFVPLALAHRMFDMARLQDVGIAFLSFSLCASCAYILNDLLDLESDRKHPKKRERPLASGRLSITTGLIAAPILLLVGLGLAIAFLPGLFAAMMVAYVLLTLAYSLYLKQQLVIDVLVLGGFYALRIGAGAVAAAITVSPWLIAFSMFFFLSLALVKRYADLDALAHQETDSLAGRAYVAADLDMIRVLGPAAGYVSVLVLALYINAKEITSLYPRPAWLWLVCVCFLYWITRVWLLAQRGEVHHDPLVFALRDRVSYYVAAVSVAVVLAAAV